MNYVYATILPGPKVAVLGALKGVEDDYELLKGVPRAEDFPDDAAFRFSDDYPRNLQLEDFLLNQNKLLVASARARALFEAEALVNVEYLPVTVLNHKGREIEEPYTIVHQVEPQKAIDEAKSTFEVNQIDPERIFYLSSLVLDEAKVDPAVRLFRLARFGQMPVFRRDLAEAVTAAGLTGIRFHELDEWDDM